MKLIIAGATGFVGTELIRQALSNPRVTSILALARRTTPIPQNTAPGADPSKLKSIVCDNFEDYSEGVKKELSGADACIWYIILKFLSTVIPCSFILRYCSTGQLYWNNR
jgi:Acetylglutamate semialdehyde dehydrogenase